MPTLTDFLSTGRLGAISVGMSQDDVRALLGDPKDRFVKKNPAIWKYGALELGFYKNVGEKQLLLSFIGLYFQGDDESLPPAVSLTGWLPTGTTTITEFRRHLDAVGVSAFGNVASEPRDHLVMPSGVRATFDGGRLHSIQFVAKTPKPQHKQVSVAMPIDELQRIREDASRRRVSAAQFCAELVKAGTTAAIKPTFAPEIEGDGSTLLYIRQICGTLNEELGRSAGLASASWSVRHDEHGRVLYVMELSDPWGKVDAEFTSEEIKNPEGLRGRLHALWGDLLQAGQPASAH